jgi:hypothetical protein
MIIVSKKTLCLLNVPIVTYLYYRLRCDNITIMTNAELIKEPHEELDGVKTWDVYEYSVHHAAELILDLPALASQTDVPDMPSSGNRTIREAYPAKEISEGIGSVLQSERPERSNQVERLRDSFLANPEALAVVAAHMMWKVRKLGISHSQVREKLFSMVSDRLTAELAAADSARQGVSPREAQGYNPALIPLYSTPVATSFRISRMNELKRRLTATRPMR